MLVNVPLFLEYEAVLTRPEHPGVPVDRTAGVGEPVKLHYPWRPQLSDVAHEMVLETAINGRADCIVTFNTPISDPRPALASR